MRAKDERPKKKYLIALEEKHSAVALLAGIIVLLCSLSAIILRLVSYESGENPLHFFTVLSNLLSAIGAAFMIPYAAEGILRKQFVLPRFVVLFQFAGAICVSITMVTTLLFILPIQGAEAAIGGTNFWLHLIAPACTLVLFQCVETGFSLSRKEATLCLIPFWAYVLVYFIMVVIVGKDNGGWEDIYKTQEFMPVWVSLLLFLAIGFGVAAVLYAVQKKRAEQTWKNITRHWQDGMEPTELLIEAFGLGRFMGARSMFGELTIPLEILSAMAERYGIPSEKLVKAYVKGALDAAEEKRARIRD